jgi:hypothetical protein
MGHEPGDGRRQRANRQNMPGRRQGRRFNALPQRGGAGHHRAHQVLATQRIDGDRREVETNEADEYPEQSGVQVRDRPADGLES